MVSVVALQLAMFDYNVFYGSTNPTAAMLLFIAFEVSVSHSTAGHQTSASSGQADATQAKQHEQQHGTQYTSGVGSSYMYPLTCCWCAEPCLTCPCAAYAWLQFVMNVLLLNVLIASMTNSFSKITQVRHLIVLAWHAVELLLTVLRQKQPTATVNKCAGSAYAYGSAGASVLACAHVQHTSSVMRHTSSTLISRGSLIVSVDAAVALSAPQATMWLLGLQDEGLRLLHSKAEIIDELEATLPQWVRSRTWYPAFVHILKIHPDATYEVGRTPHAGPALCKWCCWCC
jgi:hypothetical protein